MLRRSRGSLGSTRLFHQIQSSVFTDCSTTDMLWNRSVIYLIYLLRRSSWVTQHVSHLGITYNIVRSGTYALKQDSSSGFSFLEKTAQSIQKQHHSGRTLTFLSCFATVSAVRWELTREDNTPSLPLWILGIQITLFFQGKLAGREHEHGSRLSPGRESSIVTSL